MLPSQPSESRWHYLYQTAAIAALITVVLFLFQIVAFFVWPPPPTVAGHFARLHSRPFVGLVSSIKAEVKKKIPPAAGILLASQPM
jgi:hypothetical protein